MKYIFGFLFFLGLFSFRLPHNSVVMDQLMEIINRENIYSISIRDIDGVPVNLDSFRGKKMLIVLLPLSGQDTSVTLPELNMIQSRYGDSLIVIGVPAVEFGYTDSKKDQIKALYANLAANFILASGMKVTKSSGQDQAALFQWLTDVKKNKYFDNDVRGTGYKFFINGDGQLYAVFGSQWQLSNPIIEKVLEDRRSHGKNNKESRN